ncbi:MULTISPECIES: hypothetical protein [Oenococcus]|uniref:hypothetical protein n=1 Tax=Oenococcus TaxID=46254 RepID=UPI0039E84FAF
MIKPTNVVILMIFFHFSIGHTQCIKEEKDTKIMAKSKLIKANQKIAKSVVEAHEKITDKVVGAYTKIEDKFVDQYLTHDGESIEDAKARLKAENAERQAKLKDEKK